jgi:hypothetical protein
MISKFVAQNNVPVEHHATLTGALAGYDPAAQATVLEVINDVLALVKKIAPAGGVSLPTIPWAGIFALIPQIIAAFGDSTKWPAVIAALIGLFFPTPTPAPAP